jgi:hypothetical protein
MKTKRTKRPKRAKRPSELTLKIKSYGGFTDEACQMESMLAKKPARLRIDLAGWTNIPADTALLMRSILLARSPRTHVTTHARSSLRGPAVLVWLLGDTRLIRADARIYFRAAGPFVARNQAPAWRDLGYDEIAEEDYIRVLHAINEFLPVRELADQPIEVSTLKQFGLVDNQQVDAFLASAFRGESPRQTRAPSSKSTPANAPSA